MSNAERPNVDEAIPVCWVSREDLIYCRPDLAAVIAKMQDSEIEAIAKDVSDALQESHNRVMFEVLTMRFFFW